MQDGDVYITTKSRAPSRGPSEASHPHRRPKPQAPQKTIDDFWDAFTTRHPGKVHSILPKNRYAKSKAAHEPKGTVYDRAAHSSYDVAKAECEATVKKIARECKRVNMRYRDPHFDIEFDLKYKVNDCLEGLVKSGDNQFEPNSVKRIPVRAFISPSCAASNFWNRRFSTIPNSTLTVRRRATFGREMTAIAGSFPPSARSATRKV
jgi:hypothetical protein